MFTVHKKYHKESKEKIFLTNVGESVKIPTVRTDPKRNKNYLSRINIVINVTFMKVI